MTDKKPGNVIEALAAIMGDLPGIGRDNKSDQGYQYRGIEAITKEVQGLLSKYNVVFVPRVVSRTVKDYQTKTGAVWTEDQLQVIYRVYGPGGTQDYIDVGPIFGLGRDNSDKGSNKALTQAYKYALIQTLCIGDAKDDPDQSTHSNDGDGASDAKGPTKAAAMKKEAPKRVPRQVEPKTQQAAQEHRKTEVEDKAKREQPDVPMATAEQMSALRTETAQLEAGPARETLVKKWGEANLPNVAHPQAVLTADQFETAMRLALDATEAQAVPPSE